MSFRRDFTWKYFSNLITLSPKEFQRMYLHKSASVLSVDVHTAHWSIFLIGCYCSRFLAEYYEHFFKIIFGFSISNSIECEFRIDIEFLSTPYWSRTHTSHIRPFWSSQTDFDVLQFFFFISGPDAGFFVLVWQFPIQSKLILVNCHFKSSKLTHLFVAQRVSTRKVIVRKSFFFFK